MDIYCVIIQLHQKLIISKINYYTPGTILQSTIIKGYSSSVNPVSWPEYFIGGITSIQPLWSAQQFTPKLSSGNTSGTSYIKIYVDSAYCFDNTASGFDFF